MDVSLYNKIDKIEELLLHGEPINNPLKHRFLPGMYIREIFMPAIVNGKQNILTSMIHNTTHAYFILQGRVSVFTEEGGVKVLEAPYTGTTTPGTRRVLFIHEDCIWITVHPTAIQPKGNSESAILEAVQKITDDIIDKRENPILKGNYVNNFFVPSTSKIT